MRLCLYGADRLRQRIQEWRKEWRTCGPDDHVRRAEIEAYGKRLAENLAEIERQNQKAEAMPDSVE